VSPGNRRPARDLARTHPAPFPHIFFTSFRRTGPIVSLNSLRKELVMQLRTVPVLPVLAAAVVLGAAQVALAQVDWSFEEMVVPPGPPGSWDSYRHQAGDVVFDGTTYHQFRTGGQTFLPWDSPFHVGHWTWNALTQNWDPDDSNPVLSPEPGQWDGWTIYDLAVLYEGGVFRMWYGATASFPGSNWVGYAESVDGSHWIKDPDPLPTMAPGAPGEWDDRGFIPGTVLFDGAEYRMWYQVVKDDVPDWGTWRLGTATSPNGIDWTRHPDPVLVGSLPWEDNLLYFPEVVPYGGGYAMWYSATVYGSEAGIGYAVSPDGIHWGRWPGNPVLSPPPGSVVIEGLQVIVDGDTVHGWVATNTNIWYVTSPLDVVFFDHFETGDIDIWTPMVP
jgi:hypothetical protein